MNILVVDDHEENRYLLASLLKGNGHNVHLALHGAEALEILKADGIDLIISDILMPVMDGFQLCRKVKGDEALRHIPFVIYTATYTGPKDEEFAMKIGADRFIIKPCEPEEFLKTVDEVMAEVARRGSAVTPEEVAEEEVFKLYSERLVRKLEKKIIEKEQEIKARQKAEKALRESQEKYHSMVENIGIGVTLIGPEMEIIEMNRQMREWFPSVNPTDKPYCYKVFNDPARETVCEYCPTWKTLQDGCVHESTSATPQDGKIRNFRILSSPVRDDRGKVIAAIEMVEDITENLRLNAQFQQAQKMESVGRLAGGVAHDYNNMLGVILGYTDLALDKVDPSDPLYEDLQEILNAAKRSADITRQLLAFARKQAIVPKVLDMNAVVESMLKMLRRLIGENINLSWIPGTDLWYLKIDPIQIEQVLANLCINARDAISGVGRIIIETQKATFDETYCADHSDFSPGEYIRLAVSDDGLGMDKETLANIFEPFFTTKDASQGTGLGLATVYGIVKQNNGFINVYSEPGEGTTFNIYFPRHIGKAEEIEPETITEIPRGQGEKILLVEDEKAIRKMGHLMLERLGYQVVVARIPSEALRLAKDLKGEIKLLIVDVIMPEMNGRDLANKLQSLYPHIDTLFMSGYTADVIAHRGVLDEGVQFIQKPFSMRDLAIKVRTVLDRE